MEHNKDRIWQIRTVKNYPDAHNHLIIGKVLELYYSFVRLHCKTYHFRKLVNSPKDIMIGVDMVRIVPWDRIEIINELPSSFNYTTASLTTDKEGRVVLKDNEYTQPVYIKYDRSY